MLAFGLRGDVRVVRSGSANGTKHLSSDLLWSTPDSVIHAVWLYSLWECILTSKRRRRSCPRRHLPAIFLRVALVSIKNLKTHQFYYQIFWGPGPLTSLPMVRPPHGVHHPTVKTNSRGYRKFLVIVEKEFLYAIWKWGGAGEGDSNRDVSPV